jgi:hypothetical protein
MLSLPGGELETPLNSGLRRLGESLSIFLMEWENNLRLKDRLVFIGFIVNKVKVVKLVDLQVACYHRITVGLLIFSVFKQPRKEVIGRLRMVVSFLTETTS